MTRVVAEDEAHALLRRHEVHDAEVSRMEELGPDAVAQVDHERVGRDLRPGRGERAGAPERDRVR